MILIVILVTSWHKQNEMSFLSLVVIIYPVVHTHSSMEKAKFNLNFTLFSRLVQFIVNCIPKHTITSYNLTLSYFKQLHQTFYFFIDVIKLADPSGRKRHVQHRRGNLFEGANSSRFPYPILCSSPPRFLGFDLPGAADWSVRCYTHIYLGDRWT